MTGPRFPVTSSTRDLAHQLRDGTDPEALDATPEEIVAAYRLHTERLCREGAFAVDMAHLSLDLAEVLTTYPETFTNA